MIHCAQVGGERDERGNREKRRKIANAMVNNLVHTSKDKDGLIYIHLYYFKFNLGSL